MHQAPTSALQDGLVWEAQIALAPGAVRARVIPNAAPTPIRFQTNDGWPSRANQHPRIEGAGMIVVRTRLRCCVREHRSISASVRARSAPCGDGFDCTLCDQRNLSAAGTTAPATCAGEGEDHE